MLLYFAFVSVSLVKAAPLTNISMSSPSEAAPVVPPLVELSRAPRTVRALHQPPLQELAKVLSEALPQSFAEVSVSVAQCPDLTQPPYGLAAPGLCGDPVLVELGGVPYLVPLVDRSRLYDLRGVVAAAGRTGPAALLGAGAGPWPHLGVNCEGIVNMVLEGERVVTQRSRAAWVSPRGALPPAARYNVNTLPDDETRAALLGNYLLTDGLPGEVLKIVARNRTGASNFITAIRCALHAQYGPRAVGLGGVFVLRASAAHYHVMADFSATPLTDDDAVARWLHYLPAHPPTTNLGTLVTTDMGLDLRLQHFHGWSSAEAAPVGGHYHYDLQPLAAHYEAYLVPAARVLRLDAPAHTHDFGRD